VSGNVSNVASIYAGVLSGGATGHITPAAGVSATVNLGASNANATYAGTISDGSGNIALTKSGNGAQTLAANNSYSGGTTVTGGTLTANTTGAFGTGSVNINGGTITTKAGISAPFHFPSLTISGGRFDLNDNDMIVSYTPGDGTFATVQGYLQSGYS